MPPQLADRNLLFGIIALRIDFIDRDKLVEGMNAWVLHKQKPLGQSASLSTTDGKPSSRVPGPFLGS
jgi:hypothetical protein